MSRRGHAKAPARSGDVATNRQARFKYHLLENWETGIALQGSEVKSLRLGHVVLADAYARVIDHELWLDGVHIPPYQFAHGVGAHDPDRSRKLLLHSNEVSRLHAEVAKERLSMVPLAFYFRDGKVKVELGVGKGRRRSDKRNAMAERDSQREIARAMGRQAKGMT